MTDKLNTPGGSRQWDKPLFKSGLTAKLQPSQNKNNPPAHVLRKAVTFKPTSVAGDASGQIDAADRAAQIRLVRQRRQARESQGSAFSHLIANSNLKRGDYSGAELAPYQGRPGALDFLALPSLIGSKRIYRADHRPATTESTS